MQSSFMCSVCAVSFDEQLVRREHMRHSWHVFNLKRRLLEEPPVSLHDFEDNHNAREVIPEHKQPSKGQSIRRESRSSRDDSAQDWQDILPSHCLFCQKQAQTIDANLLHMASAHSSRIPNIERLQTDTETLIDYLRCVIHEFNSCLFCGCSKYSAEAVKAHMISKGHCMLNMSEGSDFLDFWMVDSVFIGDKTAASEDEVPSQYQELDGKAKKLSETEMILPSGARVFARGELSTSSSRGSLSSTRKGSAPPRVEAQKAMNTYSSTTTKPIHTRSLALRDTMGLIGLPNQQRRALAATEHKIMKRENRVMLQQRWIVEKIANRQKNFKPDVPGRKNG